MSALSSSPETETSLRDLLFAMRPVLASILREHSVPLADAEDLVQEALLALAYKRLAIRNPEAWLREVLRNRCRMYWRGQARRRVREAPLAELETVDELADPRAQDATTRLDLGTLIAQLPQGTRQLLLASALHGETDCQLAGQLGLSASGVRKKLQRTRAQLRLRLTALGYAPRSRWPAAGLKGGENPK